MLALMTDGSFTLVDVSGSEITLDPTGGFTELRARVVRRLAVGDRALTFDYDAGWPEPRISSARLAGPGEPERLVRYEYEPGGKLARVLTPDGLTKDLRYFGGGVEVADRW